MLSCFCVWAPELSTSCLGTCILLSPCDPVFSPPWVGCDPVSLQLPQVTNSHPGAHVIQGMYFSTLYALCPFLKFSKNLTGHRSSYQTEAVDKNSNWYTGHLKIPAPVHSHLEDTLFCWPYFGNFWHFVLMSPETGVRGRFCSQKRGLDDADVFFLVCNLILLRKCQSAGERECGHQILRALKGPLALTNRAVCPYLSHVKNSPTAAGDCSDWSQDVEQCRAQLRKV